MKDYKIIKSQNSDEFSILIKIEKELNKNYCKNSHEIFPDSLLKKYKYLKIGTKIYNEIGTYLFAINFHINI